MIRLFAALPLPVEIVEGLRRRQLGLPGARWRTAEQMHLTLRFFGEVEAAAAADLDAALAEIRVEPFNLHLAGTGAFGEAHKVRAVWAGVGESEPLARLAAKCETSARRIGLEPEGRGFRPHITLAYLKGASPGRAAAWLAETGLLRSPGWRASRFDLYSSWTSPEGSRYEVEREYPLDPDPRPADPAPPEPA